MSSSLWVKIILYCCIINIIVYNNNNKDIKVNANSLLDSHNTEANHPNANLLDELHEHHDENHDTSLHDEEEEGEEEHHDDTLHHEHEEEHHDETINHEHEEDHDDISQEVLDKLPGDMHQKLEEMYDLAKKGLKPDEDDTSVHNEHEGEVGDEDNDALIDDQNIPDLDQDQFISAEQRKHLHDIEEYDEDDAISDSEEDEMMHHHSHQKVVLSDEEQKTLFGMIRKQRVRPWAFPELLPSILHGVDWLTVATLDESLFKQHQKELLDAWLGLFHSNITELHIRSVQMIHIIKQRYSDLVLDELDRQYRELPTRAQSFSKLFDLMRVSELYGLPFTFEPIHKYWSVYWDMWKKAQNNDIQKNMKSNYTHQALMTAVLGWDPDTHDSNTTVTSYEDISHTLILLYNLERQKLTLPHVTFADAAKLIEGKRPYRGPKDLSSIEYENQVFMVLNYIQVLTDFGLTHISAHLVQEEQTLLREAIYFGIAHNNTQLVGEVVHSLQLMHVGEEDADITIAKTFLVNMQHPDGSWRQKGHRMHLGILDTYRAIVALCPHNAAWLTGDDGHHLTNELLSNERYHHMIKQIRLAGHLEPANTVVFDHSIHYKHHLHDEL